MEGEKIFVKDYKNPMKPKWQATKIVEVMGERSFLMQTRLSRLKHFMETSHGLNF